MGSAGRRRRVGVIVAVAGLAVFSLCLCGIGSAIGLSMRRGEDQPDPPPASQEPLPPPASESVPPSPSASPTPATATRVVPDVVGARLADALRRLDAAGLDEIEPIDATGQDRVVLNPENWVVRAQQPAAGTRTGTGTTVTLRVAKPSDGAPSPRVVAGVVPDVVCLDLQTAQDTLQQAGFSDIGSADGTGAGRQQLVDRNWVVVRQSAAAGSRPGRSTRIVLTAVKYGEPTGASGCRS